MKRILLGDSREPLLTTLEAVFRHWGYRVSAASSRKNLAGFLRTSTPDLLIFNDEMLRGDDSLSPEIVGCVERIGVPLLIISGKKDDCELSVPYERIDPPFDIFTLFASVQRHLEEEPRQNLRLALELPGLLQNGESSFFVDILSLSTHGMFIKTSMALEVGATLKIVAPLFGLKRELELLSRVLYRVTPASDNGYQGGVGIEFVSPSESDLSDLQLFLQQRFQEDFETARARFALGSKCDELVAGGDETILRLVPEDSHEERER